MVKKIGQAILPSAKFGVGLPVQSQEYKIALMTPCSNPDIPGVMKYI